MQDADKALGPLAEGSDTIFGKSFYELFCVISPREKDKTWFVPLKNFPSNTEDGNRLQQPPRVVVTDRM